MAWSNLHPSIYVDHSLKLHANHTASRSDPLGRLSLSRFRVSFTHFVVSAFVREPRSPFPQSYFSFMTQHSKRITNEDENPNFGPHSANSHRIFSLTTDFGAARPKLQGAVSSCISNCSSSSVLQVPTNRSTGHKSLRAAVATR
ncbi:hypothetical protein AVEN_247504-1 [Araneus ventricosus]|uniref:Uncharacterized protein n=1 Tax=Araneus ventricosus TaxID=182803 RepID=A0A4Y2LHG8_ARAVE|nr:hypothetical protein AVEN_247504-1 [Araneus ventricosus]